MRWLQLNQLGFFFRENEVRQLERLLVAEPYTWVFYGEGVDFLVCFFMGLAPVQVLPLLFQYHYYYSFFYVWIFYIDIQVFEMTKMIIDTWMLQ